MLRRVPHYYPILRLKRGEYTGVSQIDRAIDLHYTPIFELLPEHFWGDEKDERGNIIKGQQIANDTERVMKNKVDCIQKNCNNSRPIMVDFGRLSGEIDNTSYVHPVNLFYSESQKSKLTIIPVSGIISKSYPLEYQQAIKDCMSNGCRNVCFRLKISDLELDDIENQITRVLDIWEVNYSQAYLLFDMGHVNKRVDLKSAVLNIPKLQKWGKFILASGSYPEDEVMGSFRPGSHTPSRYDLINWQELVRDESYTGRIPDFSDYGIRGVRYNKFVPSEKSPAAKVTWSLPQSWAIEKGEPVNQQSDQFVYLGKALEGYDNLTESLLDNCLADQTLKQVFREDVPLPTDIRLNNFEPWIRLGTNRHITLTVAQLLQMFVQ